MCEENALQIQKESERTPQLSRGVQILKKAQQTARDMPFNMGELAEILHSSSSLLTFVKGIQKGQKLALDIPKEIMEEIHRGSLKVMTTKSGIMKAEICHPDGAVMQHMNLKRDWDDGSGRRGHCRSRCEVSKWRQ